MDNILYIDDEKWNLEVFKSTFSYDYKVFIACNTIKAVEILRNKDIQVVITDQRMPKESGIDFIERIQDEFPDVVFMILSAYSDFSIAKKALESGRVYRFILKPWKRDEMQIELNKALERYHYLLMNKYLLIDLENQNRELIILKQKLEDENAYFKEEIKSNKNFENIISKDEVFLNILSNIEQVACSDAPCLIYGETGTGKELIARAIHNLSDRKKGAFVCVNCAAIPEALFESELFGHEKGAFTGAVNQRKGKFELANGGTLFLDEIGEIPLPLQPKLLRAIQEKCVERLGGTTILNLDIRIVAATNRNLLNEVDKENFRSDLYYRLSVFPVDIPPLRERKGDIEVLTKYFISKYNAKYKKQVRTITKKSLNDFKCYSWPGNVRELENVVERAVLRSTSINLNTDDFLVKKVTVENNKIVSLSENERNYILKILEKTNWKVSGANSASEILGIKRTTLISKMDKLNICKE